MPSLKNLDKSSQYNGFPSESFKQHEILTNSSLFEYIPLMKSHEPMEVTLTEQTSRQTIYSNSAPELSATSRKVMRNGKQIFIDKGDPI